MADRLMANARDKALQEISKLSPEARAYLTALAKKSNSMNQRSSGSGDEYVKGQVRASKGTPKRVQKAAPKKAAGSTSKSVASRAASRSSVSSRSSAASRGVATSRAATKPQTQTVKKASPTSLTESKLGNPNSRLANKPKNQGKSDFQKTFIDPFGRAGKKFWEEMRPR